MTAPFSNPRGVVRVIRSAGRHLRPPTQMLPSDWAEQHVRIPAGNAIPGPIRFDNAPYQREPLDMTVRTDCHRISMMWSAQVGKTMLALCAQGFRIAANPTSQIMMQPSEGDLRTWLETKFNPMVDASDQLQSVIAPPRGRHGVNNQQMKSYPGGFIMFAWSGSPKTMRGRSAPFIVCDETDGYDRTIEGHPVSVLSQRSATYGDDALVLEISTPTTKGSSWIDTAFDEGDQRHYWVKCPHCGELQTLKWQQVIWEKSQDGGHYPDTARYVCINGCDPGWDDATRAAAIRSAEREGGGWIAEKPWTGHASYHLNELYSTMRKLPDIVRSFLAKKAAGDLQTFTNVSLAEVWEDQGAQVDSVGLMERAESFPAPVPAGGVWLSAGIDMQEDRLEVETVAWGPGEESWSIDYHVIWGDPLLDDVWRDLDDHLSSTWLHETGAQLTIGAACLDTGGGSGDNGLTYTQRAYEYVRQRSGRRLFAIKGVGGWDRPIVSAPSRKKTGKRQRPVDLFTIGSDEAKAIIAKRLEIDEPGPGYCHVPDSRDAEWFRQITAEKLITRYRRGFAQREWHKTRPRNEALDCRQYAYAALKLINPNLERLKRRMTVQNEADESVPETPPEEETPPKRKGKRKRMRMRKSRNGSSWVNNY